MVDDDIVDREHIKRTLQKATIAWRFVETDSVDKGLAAFASQSFDMVLLDYRMPQRDGIELLLALRNASFEQNVAIVMLSNSEEPE
ncbi:response regulator [Colwellia chukchiensis]|uniref:response regulator n=1 Tax=Colwellia chukchiensis TaxID=641665 RepID=UPI0022B8F1B5|nr:response regulator [Colwellia chukchiensis]